MRRDAIMASAPVSSTSTGKTAGRRFTANGGPGDFGSRAATNSGASAGTRAASAGVVGAGGLGGIGGIGAVVGGVDVGETLLQDGAHLRRRIEREKSPE